MKKLILLSLLLSATLSAVALDYKYEPLAQEGARWTYLFNTVDEDHPDWLTTHGVPPGNPSYYQLGFKGETTIEGVTYKNCYWTDCGEEIDPEVMEPVAYLRDEGKKVYVVYNWEPPTGPYMEPDYYTAGVPGEHYDSTGELLLYDFEDVAGFYDRLPLIVDILGNEFRIGTYKETRQVAVGKNLRNWHIITFGYLNRANAGFKLVEGIGVDHTWMGNFLYPYHHMDVWGVAYPAGRTMRTYTRSWGLVTYEMDGEVVYYGNAYDNGFTGPETVTGVTDMNISRPGNGIYYNLMGQPVAHPEAAPGIYIRDGKKILIR